MKLAPLLARFLYSNRRLDLPGIGTFQLDSTFSNDLENAKGDKKINPGSITFKSDTSIRESPELIQYIANETGKFKALAAADLSSHLQLVLQFLNIGKPFLLEGIGNLVKIKSGEFAFTSGQVLPESLKDYSTREISSTSSIEENFSDFRKPINKSGAKTAWRRPVAALLILAGIGLAIWGGYTVYKMSAGEGSTSDNLKNYTPVEPKDENKNLVVSDTTLRIQEDSIKTVQISTPAQRSSLKYVLEKAGAKRAFERYAKLRSFQWPVQLETKDSLTYTLFMVLPSTFSDTTRILDSLTLLNGRSVTMAK